MVLLIVGIVMLDNGDQPWGYIGIAVLAAGLLDAWWHWSILAGQRERQDAP